MKPITVKLLIKTLLRITEQTTNKLFRLRRTLDFTGIIEKKRGVRNDELDAVREHNLVPAIDKNYCLLSLFYVN